MSNESNIDYCIVCVEKFEQTQFKTRLYTINEFQDKMCPECMKASHTFNTGQLRLFEKMLKRVEILETVTHQEIEDMGETIEDTERALR